MVFFVVVVVFGCYFCVYVCVVLVICFVLFETWSLYIVLDILEFTM